MWGEIAAIVTVVVTIIVSIVAGGYRLRSDALQKEKDALLRQEQLSKEALQREKDDLRKHDVFLWSNQCIEVLQTLVFLCSDIEEVLDEKSRILKNKEIFFRTSILIEQGRLFFRNEKPDEYGQEKLAAYRGYRPIILDQLVLAHQISKKLPNSNENDRKVLCKIAENCAKYFVSLAQQEVGRDRVASKEAGDGGYEIDLEDFMDEMYELNPHLASK
jgi:hypothetical protein